MCDLGISRVSSGCTKALGVRVPVNKKVEMVATIFGLKSVTRSQFMHLKQGLCGIFLEFAVNEGEGMAILYSISEGN